MRKRAVLKLVAILLNGDLHQLRAAVYSKFSEQVAQTGLNGTLRKVQPSTDLLVGKALKDISQDRFVARGEVRLVGRPRLIESSKKRLQVVLLQTNLAASDL